jgi:hypothetical protein
MVGGKCAKPSPITTRATARSLVRWSRTSSPRSTGAGVQRFAAPSGWNACRQRSARHVVRKGRRDTGHVPRQLRASRDRVDVGRRRMPRRAWHRYLVRDEPRHRHPAARGQTRPPHVRRSILIRRARVDDLDPGRNPATRRASSSYDRKAWVERFRVPGLWALARIR